MCSKCGDFFEIKDPSQLCLHCFCMMYNLQCQCGCQNEELDQVV